MAWFNNEDDAGQPIPVTANRVMSVIKDEMKFNGNEEDGKFYCYVNGVPVRFDTAPLDFAIYINAALFEYKLPISRYEEVLEWVNQTNADTHFMHGYVQRDEGGKELVVLADAPVLTGAGMTDEQLSYQIDHLLSAVLVWSERYCEKFGFKLDTGTEDSE